MPTHYAAIVLSGKTLSVGTSGLGRCSRLCKHAVTRHAEMDAINKYKNKNRLRKSSMWSVRWKMVNGQYVLANAKPCVYCKQIALNHGIRTVFYSDDNGNINKCCTNDLNSKLTTASVIHLRQNCGYKNSKFQKSN